MNELYRSFLCLLLLFTFSTTNVLAKAAVLDSRNGLISNFITVLNKDERGIMWIGTNNGLNIYDGYTCTKLTETIGNTYISAIVNDRKRNLIWVGAANGLYKIDAFTFSITKCRINNKASAIPVASLSVNDKTGDVYAVLKNGHIAALRKKLGPNFEGIETVRGVGYRFKDDD